jgi:hypothetical protein
MQKRVRLGSLVLILSIFLIPSVFALFEGFAYAIYSPADLINIYYLWSTWIDLAILFLILSSLARLTLGRLFGGGQGHGGEEHPALKGLYLGIGLFGSFSLVLLNRQFSGFGGGNGILLGFGPLWLILLLLILIIYGYRMFSGDERTPLGIGSIIFFILLALFIGNLIYPNLFGPLLDFIFNNPIAYFLVIILLIAGIIAVLSRLFGFLANRGGAGGQGGGAGGQGSPGILGALTGRIANRIAHPPRERRFDVSLIIGGGRRHPAGGQTLLGARVTNRGLMGTNWFRNMLSDRQIAGNFHYTWNVGGITQLGNTASINYQIPQNAQGRINIQVIVLDTDNVPVQGIAADYIEVIPAQCGAGPNPPPHTPNPPPRPTPNALTITNVTPNSASQDTPGIITLRVEGTGFTQRMNLFFPYHNDNTQQNLHLRSRLRRVNPTSFLIDIEVETDHNGNPTNLGHYDIHLEDNTGNVAERENVFEILPPRTRPVPGPNPPPNPPPGPIPRTRTNAQTEFVLNIERER